MLATSSLMKNPSPSIPNLFTTGYIHTDNHMIHYMINHTLFTRKINFSLISQFDVEVAWLIQKKIKVNCAEQVIEYMMESKKEGVCLTYGNLLTKILEDTEYNFKDEKYKEETTKIGNSVIPSIQFEIINGKVTENPSSGEKKIKINDKETPMEIYGFDCFFPRPPQLPTTYSKS